MKPWIWLRVAAILDGLFTAGHTFGHFAHAPGSPEEKALFDSMRNFRFEIMGSVHSLWDYYEGFSLFVSLSMLILTLVLWFLAGAARSAPSPARPLAWTLFVGHISIAALCWKAFFLAPQALSTLAALALLVAVVGFRAAPYDTPVTNS